MSKIVKTLNEMNEHKFNLTIYRDLLIIKSIFSSDFTRYVRADSRLSEQIPINKFKKIRILRMHYSIIKF